MQAVKYIKKNGQISNRIYQEINNTTKRTASRDLTEMVFLGVVKKTGTTGKGTLYALRGHKFE
jgi:ATP-dependent DNA helicase RecG